MENRKKLPLATWILIALFLGIGAGLLLMKNPAFADSYIKPWGTLFLNLIKFVVVPVVLFSIAAAVVGMQDLKKVGYIGGRTVAFYLATTFLAVIIGLVVSNIFKGSYMLLATSGLEYKAAAAPGIIDTIVNIFPSNAVEPLVKATMLQVIVMALFIGFGVILAGERGVKAGEVIESLDIIFQKIMGFIIQLSPIGVFCLITPVVATNGPQVLGSLAMVLLVAYICYVLQILLVYAPALKAMGGMSPLKFFKGLSPAMILAFSSASSVGTLPLNMDCTQRLGARKDVVSFSLPLGATINMDGTAIYQGVCTVFIAACYGINLTLGQLLTVVLTATLASVGTAGVPGAGMIMLVMVLESVGLPVEGIALVAGVDRIFDMGRTCVNITGDSVCAIVVSKMLDRREGR